MMNNLKTIIITFLFLFILPFYVYGKELPRQYGVSVNKVWNINFNTEIDARTLEGNITITDTDGKVTDITLGLSNDCKTVIVTPKIQYTPGKVYKISANKNIKSLKGNSISDDVTKVFSVQSNEEILAHLPPEDWNIFIATDEELAYYGYPARPKDAEQLKEWKKTVSGGWYDVQSNTFPNHSHTFIPCRIIWNKQVYVVDVRCGPINGEKIGQDGDGQNIYEIPGVNSSNGIILGFSDKDGHRCTRDTYNVSDALSMLFSDTEFLSERVGNVQFPKSQTKVKASVNLPNKSIPVELETKVDESEKPIYIITLTETWNTKDYYYDGCTQPIGKHHWSFKITLNEYSDLDQGGDIPPQSK